MEQIILAGSKSGSSNEATGYVDPNGSIPSLITSKNPDGRHLETPELMTEQNYLKINSEYKDQRLDEMEADLLDLRNKLFNLENKVTPLQAITDLALADA